MLEFRLLVKLRIELGDFLGFVECFGVLVLNVRVIGEGWTAVCVRFRVFSFYRRIG